MAKGKTVARGYGGRWRRLRIHQLNAHPLCEACQAEGRVRAAEHVDHIVPLADGGTHDPGNLQSLCAECHGRKSQAEGRRKGAYDGNRFGAGGQDYAPVVVVCGPPGSGKSTWVNDRLRWGDLRVDLDAIMSALSGRPMYETPASIRPFGFEARDAVLDRLERRSDLVRAYVIASAPDPRDRAKIASRFGADVVVFETPAVVCIQRIRDDARRGEKWMQWGDLVNQWWRDYRPRDGERVHR